MILAFADVRVNAPTSEFSDVTPAIGVEANVNVPSGASVMVVFAPAARVISPER
jgi:hypothetical protein